MLKQKFKKVIKLIYTKLRDKNIKWAIIGTTNLALQGIKVKPKDLDIITDVKSLRMIKNLFKDFVSEQIKKGPSSKEKLSKFYELKLKIKGIDCHIIGEKNSEIYLNKIKNIVLIKLENIKVPCLSLESGIKAYSKMGQNHKVKLIKEFLKNRN